jgi:hypothetical protein
MIEMSVDEFIALDDKAKGSASKLSRENEQ